jgi:hypothetical protein
VKEFYCKEGNPLRLLSTMMDDDSLSLVLADMTQQQRSALIEGWLSPRMKMMLLLTAELEESSFQDDGVFQSRVPTLLSDCCSYGFNRIGYIPLYVLEADPRGIFRSFKDGYSYCFLAIAAILRRDRTPTVQRIHHEIISHSSLYDGRKFQFYLEKGGKIEFAIYAVIQITQNVLFDGDDGWEYSMFEDEIEALPSNPLDECFEGARLRCINGGGGTPQDRCGPFPEVTHYDDNHGDSDDSDIESDRDSIGGCVRNGVRFGYGDNDDY